MPSNYRNAVNKTLRGAIFLLPLILFFLTTNSYALRIVSLSPSITETIFALGAGNSLVGDTVYCNYPDEAKKIPKVGGYINPNLEKIVTLKPDIVLGIKDGIDKSIKVKLDELHIKNRFYTARNINDIKYIIVDIAKITHTNPLPLIKRIDKYYSTYQPSAITGLFFVSANPMIVAGNHTFINEILKCSGVKNLAEHLSYYPQINNEFLINNRPKIIILSVLGKNHQMVLKKLIKRFHLNSKMIIVNPDLYNRPSYRIVDACLDLRKRIKKLN